MDMPVVYDSELLEGKSNTRNISGIPSGMRTLDNLLDPLHNAIKNTIESLYIREFTNGWAVYNRSGQCTSHHIAVICDLCI